VLRLRHALSLSYREIGEALGVSKTAAGEIVRRAEVIGLSWPLPQLFDDGELERRLFITAAGEAQTERPAPDWAKLHEDAALARSQALRCQDAQRAALPIARCPGKATVSDAWLCARRWRSSGRAQRKLQARFLHEGNADAASGNARPETGGQRPDPETPGWRALGKCELMGPAD